MQQKSNLSIYQTLAPGLIWSLLTQQLGMVLFTYFNSLQSIGSSQPLKDQDSFPGGSNFPPLPVSFCVVILKLKDSFLILILQLSRWGDNSSHVKLAGSVSRNIMRALTDKTHEARACKFELSTLCWRTPCHPEKMV